MAEPRKNHLNIDGGQVKEDEHVASYKPIPETDTEFRTSRNNLSKSKQNVSGDGAEEKLLQKEDEAKIVTRVDMADAKYVVGDHRNGDAKIELDANKRQFSGLTKEELLKYADDPFWVKLRWFLFVVFWVCWLAMLAGAIAIIVQAPKCPTPVPKTWFEKGPLVDTDGVPIEKLEAELPALKQAKVEGIFVDAPTYEVLEKQELMEPYKSLLTKAKEHGIKLIVDLIPNYVWKNHTWFALSENRTDPYTDYFIWKAGGDTEEDGGQKPPNNWMSISNKSAWEYNNIRKEFYLHQYGTDQPDLNLNNTEVLSNFNKVLTLWLKAGVGGVRLNKVRHALVDQQFAEENFKRKVDVDVVHTDSGFWERKKTTDQQGLFGLLSQWADIVDKNSTNPGSGETVFTIEENEGDVLQDLYLTSKNLTSLKPVSASPVLVNEDVDKVVSRLRVKLEHWPALQLLALSDDAARELTSLAALLPAAPVFTLEQIRETNDTGSSESLSHLISLREDASIAHGESVLAAVPAVNSTGNKLIACARWKKGHTGFLAVFNPTSEELRANLTLVTSVPDTVTVHHISHNVKLYTNYTNSHEAADNVLVPPQSSVVLSYVPTTSVEN